LRVYLNGEKIWDLPRAFDAATVYNAVTMGMDNPYRKEDFFLLGNIRLAVGAPDTRSKLITEGKFVTRGILFDVNSDVVKAESYGTIKDIANVLNENSTVRVKIIGHTDSDGDDKSNLELSKKRAVAVRNSLITEFGIEDSRIETDGKGESQPVDKTETVVGKANNRRVEFVKL
jgi:outer membrane protein OmpA-like peptidoglycan-associated protein